MPAASTKLSAAMCTCVPIPADPKLSLPGWALPSAMNSFSVFAGTAWFTTSTCGPLATLVTATKSCFASKGIFAYMCGFTVTMLPDVIRIV